MVSSNRIGSRSFYTVGVSASFSFFSLLPLFVARLRLWVSSKSLVAQFDWFGVVVSMVANWFFGPGLSLFLFFALPFFAFFIFCSLNIFYFFVYKYLFLSFVYGSWYIPRGLSFPFCRICHCSFILTLLLLLLLFLSLSLSRSFTNFITSCYEDETVLTAFWLSIATVTFFAYVYSTCSCVYPRSSWSRQRRTWHKLLITTLLIYE